MITANELAKRLNGRGYCEEITSAECTEAMEAGLLVVFGRSDNLVELRGTADDEVSAWDGTIFDVCEKGLCKTWEQVDTDSEDEAREYFEMEGLPRIRINAEWDVNGVSWEITTDSEIAKGHTASFDVMEGDEVYCRGLVVDMKCLVEVAP